MFEVHCITNLNKCITLHRKVNKQARFHWMIGETNKRPSVVLFLGTNECCCQNGMLLQFRLSERLRSDLLPTTIYERTNNVS